MVQHHIYLGHGPFHIPPHTTAPFLDPAWCYLELKSITGNSGKLQHISILAVTTLATSHAPKLGHSAASTRPLLPIYNIPELNSKTGDCLLGLLLWVQ